MHIVIGKGISGEFYIGKLEEKIILSDKAGKVTVPILTGVYNLILQQLDKNHPEQLRTLMIPVMMPFDDKPIKEISIDKFIISIIEAPEEIFRTYVKLTTGLDIAPSGSKVIVQ